MTIGVTATTQTQPTTPTRVPKNSLDKDAFLELLITQMRHQDPLQPTDDREFMAQMAQFTALEQSRNSNRTLATLSALALQGRDVAVELGSEKAEGTVETVKVNGEQIEIYIGGKSWPLESVREVKGGA
jgi:flagellar basal-body rod modification protein FlgD